MPDNIRSHVVELLSPYIRKHDAQEKIDSARLLAKLALENDTLHKQHRKTMLSNAIWYCTEVDGKWRTRYKTKAVVDLAQSDPTSLVRINHEHVFTRKYLVSRMLDESAMRLDQLPALY